MSNRFSLNLTDDPEPSLVAEMAEILYEEYRANRFDAPQMQWNTESLASTAAWMGVAQYVLKRLHSRV